MSGHNKWSTIKHKKGKTDAARGKLFTKIIKEITIAARAGGGDENANPRLRTAVASAKTANMPVDNIARAIKKGTGELEGVSYDEIYYEGYGPEGVAILVQTLTDNRNRTISDIRHTFGKYAGKIAEPGAVAWIFEDAGNIIVSGDGVDEEKLMEVVMEGGGDDMEASDDGFEISCSLSILEELKVAIEGAGFTVEEAEYTKKPSNSVAIEGKSAQSLLRLLNALEELDDVQNIFSNFDMDDDLLDEEQ